MSRRNHPIPGETSSSGAGLRARPTRIALLLIGLMASFLLVADARPALATQAPAMDDDDDDKPSKGPRLAPGKELGLALTLSRGETKDVRGARVVSLRVPEGTPPSPFLVPGPFRATWEGEFTIAFKSDYVFAATGRGTIKVEVNGKAVLNGSGEDLSTLAGKTAKLRKGANKVVVTYDSPKAGDAIVRLSWSSEEFGREPISPVSLARDTKLEGLAAGTRVRDGRELLATLRCLKCHAPDKPVEGPGSMPELATDAPSLEGVGARLKADWLARWIADPRSLRPTATMPKVLHGPTSLDDSRDIAAYLATIGKPEADAPLEPEAVTLGGRAFANLGCVGCHTLPDRDDWATAPNRVPLRNVGAKWNGKALVAFLKQPDRHYAWIRMPNFHLTDLEAKNLAAYLLSAPAKDLASPGRSANPDHGKTLLASSGCLNCHAIPSDKSTSQAPAFAAITADAWSRGCLEPSGKSPDFGLSEASTKALRAFARLGLESLKQDAAPEFAERQVKSLKCIACHKRDGYDDAWSDLAPEVEKLLVGAPSEEKDPDGLPYPASQVRPSMTWIGEKLKPEWASSFIAGKVPYKPRPYLKARMPAFAVRAEGLAHGLALEHGIAPTSPPDAKSDPTLIPIAKQLVKGTGLNCVSCHNVGRVAAVGVFEAPGINFMHIEERLLPDYFDRWVRAPIRVDPETKMPSYFTGDASVLPTILDGKADKQIQALWNYILQGQAIEPPGN